MHKLLITATLACAAQFAHAAEAGKIIFVAGAAKAGDRPAVEGAQVEEGQMLTTGADGYIYVKTADNGLFILRPQTQARIVTYRIDQRNPANTKVKFELISGTARSRSGDAVKHARQNFRFNTPVAAIGVRGTDFTVVTDSDTSRVSVFSGGVVVSGFAGGCRPEGAGPCEGSLSRELSAAQRGQLLQVTRGQTAPQVVEAGSEGPSQAAPRLDEPLSKNGSGQPNVSVEAAKNLGLVAAIDKAGPPSGTPVPMPNPGTAPNPTPTPTPVPTLPVDPPVVVVPPQLERRVVWGRWQEVNLLPAQIDYATARRENELIALNGYFALYRTPGKEYVTPNNGSIGFTLRGSEAYVITEYGGGISRTHSASLSNGALNIDFGKRSFETSMDLTTQDDVVKLRGEGTVRGDGRFSGDANGRMGYLNIQGVLSNERVTTGTAATIFDGRIDERRRVNGGATWR
ncbi:FecR domain-containing protein [Massilia sp. CFBP9012]|uniref:FecR family protein n=1 Tax=Massilia sp. CFBP9012 TaxID=3096531 RepID=UPI002A6A81F1|nr:FecR domain-containing protein [Massilia sp. CFBP9012]MDY0978195.1 FecR domain-containing protein [Massilia sp. CFBP9012]